MDGEKMSTLAASFAVGHILDHRLYSSELVERQELWLPSVLLSNWRPHSCHKWTS
jgi:hypothetical protein